MIRFRACTITTILVLAVIMFQGCLGQSRRVRETHYYTLDYTLPEIIQGPPLPATLRIDRFLVSPEYDTDRIVYSEKQFSRRQYNYHRWRSSPRNLVTYFITRDFEQSRLFNGVFSYQTLFPASYSVSGTIDAFYESDEGPWKAVLTLRMALLKEDEKDRNKRIVFKKTYTVIKECNENHPMSFVRAMSDAMAEISGTVIGDIYHCIGEDLGIPPPQLIKKGLLPCLKSN